MTFNKLKQIMFLTQRIFVSVMETVQINAPRLGDFYLYSDYLDFFSFILKFFNLQVFPDKILEILFRITKLESVTKIQEIVT